MPARPGGVRERLVAEAVRLLDEHGPEAVQARPLTKAAGATTSAVYHYFGGMTGLLRAVADDGFARLERELATVAPSSDPVSDVCALALAYRRAAIRAPHLYDLMFGLGAPGGTRPEPADTLTAATGPAAEALSHLVHAVTRSIDHQRLHPGDPRHAAAQLWSMLHGYVSLELAGHFHGLDDPVATVLLPLGANVLVGLGDRPRAVAASAQDALLRGR